jgi:glucose-1-phosphate adenylyltransferase
VRKAARHFRGFEARYYLILAGDHLYRMDYQALLDAHVAHKADITIAAQPVDSDTATQMGVFRFARDGQIVAFEEKPNAARLADIGRSIPEGSTFATHAETVPFMASMGVYVFSRDILLDMLEREPGMDFGRELIPGALAHYIVKPFLYRGYWADVGTIESFYEANVMLCRRGAPFRFWDPSRPIYTHLRHLPGTRVTDSRIRSSIIDDGCYLDRCDVDESVVGIRTSVGEGSRIARSVLLGADWYEDDSEASDEPAMGIGRDVRLDRVIIDKNARIGDGVRLVNEKGVQHEDGDGYVIRGGIIVVPKGGIIPAGTVV